MEQSDVIETLAALAQPTRLEAYRALAAKGPYGMRAGDLSRELDVPQNTLSGHLNILAQAGLVDSERAGRTITYRVRFDRLRACVLHLVRDCCGGEPDLCSPLVKELECCLEGEGKTNG